MSGGLWISVSTLTELAAEKCDGYCEVKVAWSWPCIYLAVETQSERRDGKPKPLGRGWWGRSQPTWAVGSTVQWSGFVSKLGWSSGCKQSMAAVMDMLAGRDLWRPLVQSPAQSRTVTKARSGQACIIQRSLENLQGWGFPSLDNCSGKKFTLMVNLLCPT